MDNIVPWQHLSEFSRIRFDAHDPHPAGSVYDNSIFIMISVCMSYACMCKCMMHVCIMDVYFYVCCYAFVSCGIAAHLATFDKR